MANPQGDGAGVPHPGSQTARRIVPRRGLPTGRALVGALLVTVAAVGAFSVAAAGDNGPDTAYLILVNDVEAGDSIELSDVELAPMTLPAAASGSALRSTVGLEGATALNPLHAGEVLDVRDLNGAAFIDGGPVTDVHELTFPVRRDRAPAVLRPGDRVTVLALDEPQGSLHTALEDALVLSYVTDAGGLTSSEEGVLTLALPDADLVAAGVRASYHPLTIVLTSRALDDDYDDVYGGEAGT